MTKTKRNIIIIVAAVVAAIGITLAIVLPLTLNKNNGPYTVTFESNGGTAVESLVNVAHGSTIAEPTAPTRLGYTFESWCKDEKLTKPWKFNSDKVTANITLYAKWTHVETVGLDLVLNETSYTVIGLGDVKDANVVIPAAYKGLPVTTIAEKAFENVKSIETVFIPESVKEIKRAAFRNCEKLTAVIIEGQTTTLGEQVFSNCANLVDINLPREITAIEKELFLGCVKLANVEIPAKVTSIGDLAFSMCRAITEVKLPSSLRSLGKNVFSGCIGIASLSVDNNPLFYSRENGQETNCIIEIIPQGGNESISKLVVGCKTSKIPTNPNRPIKIIGQGAFYGCTTFETASLTIPYGVEVIEDDAFQNCTGIQSLYIPASVKSIGDRAFSSCESLTIVEFRQPTEGSTDTGIQELGQEVFSYTLLTAIHLPGSLTSVGRGLLCGCDFDHLTISYGDDASKLQTIIEYGSGDYNVLVIVNGTRNSTATVSGLA